MPSIFPNTKAGLHSYLTTLVKYLPANALRLQINPARITEFLNLMGDQTTPDTYLYNYAVWSDKKVKRTSYIVVVLLTLENQLKKLLREIYNDIPSSLWQASDRETLRRKDGLPHKVSFRHTAIEGFCHIKVVRIGGGRVRILCKRDHDSTRPSLPIFANAVEIAYKIGIPYFVPEDTDTEKAGTRIGSQIMHADDGTTKVIFTRASFYYDLGVENAGKDLHIYARWTNTKNPRIAAPWTGPVTVILI